MTTFRLLASAAVALVCFVLLVGCGDESGDHDIIVSTDKGPVTMSYTDLVVGKGAAVKKLDTVEVHYTGKLTDGRVFDSSLTRGKPLRAPLVERGLIKGWIEGIPGMKVGGKRMLYIPSELAYGEKGAGQGPKSIKPNSALIFEVEVLRIVPPSEPDLDRD